MKRELVTIDRSPLAQKLPELVAVFGNNVTFNALAPLLYPADGVSAQANDGFNLLSADASGLNSKLTKIFRHLIMTSL